jgi:hypothetical protein
MFISLFHIHSTLHSLGKSTRRYSGVLIAGVSALILSGCDFLNSASELTFGAGQVPVVSQEMNYPSVDEITQINEGENEEAIPGLPNSLEKSTMAHLVGALSAQGECGQVINLAEGALMNQVQAAYFELSSCAEDGRCADSCPDGFYGLNAQTSLEFVVLSAEQTEELTKLLTEESASAIVQIRLQIQALSFYQGDEDNREVTNSLIEGFELWLGAPGVESLLLLSPEDLNRIALGTEKGDESGFERYEIPRNSDLAETLISNILKGESVSLKIEQRFRIPREHLYLMDISPAGLIQVIQPEIVINAIEAATSSL